MEYQQASPATNFSKKLTNGGGLTGKHAYDGVFGGPANPGARMEDYREIFGGSAKCSIPVLDFPEMKERNFSIGARGLRPDYSAIFGGCGEADFGVPYEEMEVFSKAKRGKSRGQEERVQTEASSPSVEPKPSNSTEEKRAQSPEVSSTTFDDVQQFNLSYNKSNPGIKNGSFGTTHVTQLNAVPGYTHLIDEQATQNESNSGKLEQTTLNDASLNANANEEKKERKPSSKSVSGPQPQESSEAPKKTRRHWSFANDVSFDFEIGLGSQPSTSPSNVGNDVGPMKSKSGAFGGDGKESGNGSYSPLVFDEDLDVNSAAAAVRKAIEEAQAKLRIARELMERKKQGLPDHVKPSFSNGVTGKKRERKVAEKTNGFCSTKEPNAVKVVGKESNSAQVDFRLHNKSRNSIGRFSVPVVDEEKETAVEVNREVNSEDSRPSTAANECKEKMMGVEENKKQENFQRDINPVEVTFRWDIFRHDIKPDEELHQVEENKEVARAVNENFEAACGPDMTHLPEENEEVARVVEAACGPDMTNLHEENEEVARDVDESSEAACGPDMTNLPEEYAETAIEELETRDAVDQVGDEMRGREAESQEEMKVQSNEALKEENENEIGYVTGQKEELESTECERKQEESFCQEENDKSRISNPKPEGARKWFAVNREEVIGAIRSSLWGEEDSDKKQGENYDTGSDGDLVDSTESDSIFQEDYQMNEISKQRAQEAEDFEDKNNIEVVENLEAANHVYKLDDDKNPGEIGEADGLGGKFEVAEDTVENVAESSEFEETERESKVVNEANDWVEKENAETGDMEQGPSVSDNSSNQTAEMYLGEPELMFHRQQLKYQMTEFEHFEEASFSSSENERDVGDQGTDISGQASESNTVSSSDGKWFSSGVDSEMPFTSEKQVDEGAKEPQDPINHEEFETYFESSVKEEDKVQESQESTQQNMEKNENHRETQTAENRGSEVNLKKKVENREKMEEMRMKEMERMAVERAIREVRERAFAEAKEKAEQAAAKKAAAGAKERAEKVSSERNARSAADKASMEAKLKAQRAAVERATAEARERALRKALSEKSSSRTGKQAEKSTTEKVSGASRGSETKPNDQQSKGSGELAEKCKYTYERNQRTAERAAKALAEKNMRDLQAQKEQAERNRLAEILDAEVKRWATGKERNLRALLSTLQYILGSESGWQPIPLTDLIASAAVKKAYRKATLFVHPDKLQQRGASLQQKYTCEKVFDLLKDAWNKFSAEEQ